MIRPSTPKIIRGEAFDKVCKFLNTFHHVRRTDWDLHVPAVLWASRTMCKTLTVQELPKLKYEAGAVIPMEHVKPSPCLIAPIDTTISAAWKERITHLQEAERIGLEEEIGQ